MKVKISYGLELEEVPEHMATLVAGASQKLSELSLSAERLANDIRAEAAPASTLVDSLRDIRSRMEKIDTLLSDFGSILLGFEQAKLSPETFLATSEKKQGEIESEKKQE